MTYRTDSEFTGSLGQTTQGTTTRIVRGSTASVTVVKGILFWRRSKKLFKKILLAIKDGVTPAGWLVFFGAAIGLSIGFALGWVELVTIGIVATIVIIISIPFLFGIKAYEVSLELEKDRVTVGQVASGAITARNISTRITLPGFIDVPVGEGLIEVRVPTLRGAQKYSENIEIAAVKRGLIQVGPASIRRGDPLNLLRRERTWQEEHDLFVHPKTIELPSTSTGFIRDLEGNPSRIIVNDDLSFHAIREYQAGDSRRHVHWKSTAKTGTLMVRQYEETRRSEMIITLAAKSNEFRSDAEFELAVSAAASLGLRALRDGRELVVISSDELPEFARKNVASLRELNARSPRNLLDELTTINHSEQMHTLPEITALAAETNAHASIAFFVCGSGVNAQILQRAALPFSGKMLVIAVIADLHAEPGIWALGDTLVVTVGILEDLRQLLLRGKVV